MAGNLRKSCALAALLAVASPAQQPVLAGRLLSRDGTAAAGATIELRHRVHPELPLLLGQVLGDRGLGSVTATADGEGRFRIELPHRGPFELTAAAATGDDRAARLFPVMAGDFVEARLEEPFVIAGQVRDRDGVPVPRLALDVVPHATSWSRLSTYRLPEPRGSTATDAEGRFRLLSPAGYLRSATWEAFATLQPVDCAGALPIGELLRPTAHCRELGLVLQTEPMRECTVLAADGTPAAGATLLTADTRVPAQPLGAGRLRWRREVPQVLYALAPRHSPTPLVDVVSRFLTNGKSEAAPIVRLRPATPRTVRLADASGPLADRQVVLALATEDGSWLPFRRDTDRDGAVLLEVLAGDSELQIHVDAGAQFVCAFRGRATALPHDAPIRVEPPRSVDGQLLDLDGAPVPRARVLLHPEKPPHRQPYCVTWTDRGGRFAFPAAQPGALWLQADACAAGIVPTTRHDDARGILLRVAFTGSITGTIRDAEGNALPRAWISLSRSDDGARDLPAGPRDGLVALTFLADGEGRFVCRGLPPGSWRLHANALREQRWLGALIEVATDAEDVAVTCAVQRN